MPLAAKRRKFEKRRAGIDQPHDAVARQQLVARHMALARLLGAALRGFRAAARELFHQRLHGGLVGLVLAGIPVDGGAERGH
jgi:hypothetical protein